MPRTVTAFNRSPARVHTPTRVPRLPRGGRRASSFLARVRATPAFFYRDAAGDPDCGPAGAALTIAAPLALTWAIWPLFCDGFYWVVTL